MGKDDKIDELKRKYVEYFKDVPIQRYAAMAIGRNEDTIIRWREEDPAFAESVQIAKSEWIRKKVIACKAEFALERLEKSIFSIGTTENIEHNSVPVYDPKKAHDYAEFLKWQNSKGDYKPRKYGEPPPEIPGFNCPRDGESWEMYQ